MMQWSRQAKDMLDNALREAGVRAAHEGADASEVMEDIRQRVEQELAARNCGVVSSGDVEAALAALGVALPVGAGEPAAASSSRATAAPERSGCRRFFASMGRALAWAIPAIALLWELAAQHVEKGMLACKDLFFDPIPTWVHVMLVATVPAAIWLAQRRQSRAFMPAQDRWGRRLWGCALVVALWYAVKFAAVVPMALMGLMAIIYFGIGLIVLLPLSPYISIIYLTRSGSRFGASWRNRQAAQGFAVGLLLLVGMSVPGIVTRVCLDLAASEDPAQQVRGVQYLRHCGSREVLAERCISNGWRGEFGAMDLLDPLRGLNLTSEAAQRIFYRVYGEPFYKSITQGRRSGFRRAPAQVDVAFDNGQGGDEVGQGLAGLALTASRLDATVEPDTASAYLEWTLEFTNDSHVDREARAQIGLPPGAVVSRLTLWINGEEREAAFGGRSQVKEAYKKIVRARRDPLLVTSCGDDRVLMQCFPVPRNGGTMKVRLGVTVPTPFAGADRTVVGVPVFLERNFNLRKLAHHDLWFVSRAALTAAGEGWVAQTSASGEVSLHASLPAATVSEGVPRVYAHYDGALPSVASSPDLGTADHVIVTRIADTKAVTPTCVVLAVDASAPMAAHVEDLLAALPRGWPGVELAVVLAERETVKTFAPRAWDAAATDAAAEFIRATAFEGGQDNVPALLKAWDLAATAPRGVVLWVHGPCYETLGSADALRQRLERSHGVPAVHDLQAGIGPHRLVEQLEALPGHVGEGVWPVAGDAVREWFARAQTQPSPRVVRSREPAAPADAHAIPSPHPARLWAASHVRALLELHAPVETQTAAALAASYYLVTPVSGAVVLETQEQFKEAGLETMPANVVAVVPEPETWALVLAGMAVFGLQYVRRRRRAQV